MNARVQGKDGSLLWRTARTIFALIQREMSTTYGRTPGGYLWAVLEPAVTIGIMSMVFTYGLAVRTPPIGTSYALFFATGSIPFQTFNGSSNVIANSMNYSRALLSYPGVTYLDAVLARFILKGMTQLMISYIVFGCILMIFDTGAALSFPEILNSFCMVMVLGFGIGCVNAYLIPVYPIYDTVWSIATTPLFILSCVLMTFDQIPEAAREYLWYNPLVHVIGEMRRGFYPNYVGDYVSPGYVYLVGMTCSAIGLMLLRRHHRVVTNL